MSSKRFNDAVDGSRELIRENPVKSILISAAAGALLGFMLGRRSR